jgi:hypothetical protein
MAIIIIGAVGITIVFVFISTLYSADGILKKKERKYDLLLSRVFSVIKGMIILSAVIVLFFLLSIGSRRYGTSLMLRDMGCQIATSVLEGGPPTITQRNRDTEDVEKKYTIDVQRLQTGVLVTFSLKDDSRVFNPFPDVVVFRSNATGHWGELFIGIREYHASCIFP